MNETMSGDHRNPIGLPAGKSVTTALNSSNIQNNTNGPASDLKTRTGSTGTHSFAMVSNHTTMTNAMPINNSTDQQ